MLNNVKAAIFDLDGTLIDSMWIWDKIDDEYLASKGCNCPDNLKDDINHLSFEETAVYFKNRFNISDPTDVILNTWNRMAFDHYSNDITLKAGVIPFLEYLKANNIKIGLATSNNHKLLNAALECTKISKYFDCITITDEVKKGKSNPDIYLLSAKKLNAEPTECIVFEDILEAATGAKLANMKVIAVHDKYAEYQKSDLQKLCSKYIYSFEELI